jgi:hypothetical protein
MYKEKKPAQSVGLICLIRVGGPLDNFVFASDMLTKTFNMDFQGTLAFRYAALALCKENNTPLLLR